MSLNWQQYHRFASSPTSSPALFASFFSPTCHMRLNIFLSKHMSFISQSMPPASISAARCLLEQKNPFFACAAPLFGNGPEQVQNICVLSVKMRKCLYFACGVHSQRTLWESAFCVCALHFCDFCVRVALSLRRIQYYDVFL